MGSPDRDAVVVLAACGLPALVALSRVSEDPQARDALIVCVVVGLIGYWATKRLIPILRPYTLRAGLSGLDINKRGSPAGETPVSGSPAEPAACVLEPLDFPVVSAPPVTEADQAYGPPGAPITFIEYADFQ